MHVASEKTQFLRLSGGHRLSGSNGAGLLIAAVDLTLLLASALAIGREIVVERNRRNLKAIGLLITSKVTNQLENDAASSSCRLARLNRPLQFGLRSDK